MWSRTAFTCSFMLARAGRLRAGGRGGDLAGLEIGVERHLRVDGDVLAAGQVNDHVGAAGTGSEVMLDCMSKSTRSIRPAASTTLRSWVSPQTPRVLFERSADASDSAVVRSRSSDSVASLSCWLSSPCCRLRWDSSSVTFVCMSVRVS